MGGGGGELKSVGWCLKPETVRLVLSSGVNMVHVVRA
jgi:hypothetical protein